jgi:type I restriction enzyme S subunit
MSWKKVKLKQILKQYRIEHLVQNDIEYKQVTISKYDGVTFRGTKMGKEIGRKRQFKIDLKKYPNTLMFVRQGVQDGSIGIAPLEVDGCIATENMPMFSIEGINLEYLKFLLKSPYFYDELNKIQTTGSAQKSIHEREILEIEIPFPDIDEQEEIVKELSSKKDNSIEISTELTHQLTLVKKLRQQLLQDAVQGKLMEQNPKDEPASELLKKIKDEKEKLIAEKVIKQGKIQEAEKQEELLFEIPDNWVWCNLDEISKNITDGTHQTPTYTKEGRIFLSAQNIKPFKFMPEEHKFVSEETYQEIIKNRKPEKGDILIARVGAGIGEAAVINQEIEFCFYVSLGLVQPFKEYLNTEYLSLVINSPYGVKYAKGNISSKGGSAGNFNLGRIRSFLIPLPPLAEQNRIILKVDELMQYCNELEASIKQSESQNEKLLQQVLREALRKEPVGV